VNRGAANTSANWDDDDHKAANDSGPDSHPDRIHTLAVVAPSGGYSATCHDVAVCGAYHGRDNTDHNADHAVYRGGHDVGIDTGIDTGPVVDSELESAPHQPVRIAAQALHLN
jgi:hypothetical protein